MIFVKMEKEIEEKIYYLKSIRFGTLTQNINYIGEWKVFPYISL